MLADEAHVFTSKEQKFVFIFDLLKVDILQAVLHCEWHVNFTVDDAALQVEFTDFFFDVKEEVAHQKDVHFLNVFHLHGVDAVNFRN